jgi:hypothetical protein
VLCIKESRAYGDWRVGFAWRLRRRPSSRSHGSFESCGSRVRSGADPVPAVTIETGARVAAEQVPHEDAPSGRCTRARTAHIQRAGSDRLHASSTSGVAPAERAVGGDIDEDASGACTNERPSQVTAKKSASNESRDQPMATLTVQLAYTTRENRRCRFRNCFAPPHASKATTRYGVSGQIGSRQRTFLQIDTRSARAHLRARP